MRASEKAPFVVAVRRFEREYILRALIAHGGNVTHTAAALGISRKGLQLKLRKHRLDASNIRRDA